MESDCSTYRLQPILSVNPAYLCRWYLKFLNVVQSLPMRITHSRLQVENAFSLLIQLPKYHLIFIFQKSVEIPYFFIIFRILLPPDSQNDCLSSRYHDGTPFSNKGEDMRKKAHSLFKDTSLTSHWIPCSPLIAQGLVTQPH